MPIPHGFPVIDDAAFADFVDAIGSGDARVAVLLFVGEARCRVVEILAAAVSGDRRLAARQAHAVAGAAATFALPALEAASRRVERAVLEGTEFGEAAAAVGHAAEPAISALLSAIGTADETSQ